MAKKRGIGQIVTDLERKINDDYNALIQLTAEGLATEENSPVDTGFFASSWKASTQKIRAQDKREDLLRGLRSTKPAIHPATNGFTPIRSQRRVASNLVLRCLSLTTSVNPRFISATPLSTRGMPLSRRKWQTLSKAKCVLWSNKPLATNVLAAFLPELDPAAACLGLIPSSKP